MRDSIKVGDRFGRWEVVGDSVSRNASRDKMYPCRCECGTLRDVREPSLRSGRSTSCGCRCRERTAPRPEPRNLHGHSRTTEYRTWQAMKTRCYNPRTERYHRYGGRGIKVCDRWLNSFENFLADMGPKPGPEYSIDRENNDGDYRPGNCRWATQTEQQFNRSDSGPNKKPKTVTRKWERDRPPNTIYLEHAGKRQSIRKWAKETGIPTSTIRWRHRQGWPPSRILLK